MDFDTKFKVENPSPVTQDVPLTFARRGTKISFSVTTENKIQIQKLWTGPHTKQEVYEYPPEEVPKEMWRDQLQQEGYKIK